jgi:predicted Zn finger-like uncharacterized protein
VTIEVQCSSCHTRYRIDEQVLPEGTPTFKCSRCGHVFTIDPRGAGRPANSAESAAPAPPATTTPRTRRESGPANPDAVIGEKSVADSQSGWVADSSAADSASVSPRNNATALNQTEAAPASVSTPAPAPEEKKPPTDDLLSKPFDDHESSPGENFRFDFSEEDPEPETPVPPAGESGDDRHAGEWQVGEADFEVPGAANPFGAPPRGDIADAPMPRTRRARVGQRKLSTKEEREEFLDENAAPIYNHSVVTHSARFFVALFALIALGYGATTVLIRSAPAPAAEILSHLPKVGDRFIPPVAPARLVAMRDVHSDYLRTKGGHTALVVTGIAENVGNHALHAVQIAASLHDATQHTLASRMVYCGNNLSAPMVAQMTPHELDFFQKLDPPKAFALEPSATSPFVIVFIDPPSAVSRFDVSVASAGAIAPPPPDNGG